MSHPGTLLTTMIKEQGRTQKQFAILVGKKVSEVNELIKGKRNITIQWDYLLHKVLGTQQGYWINKQIAYEYQIFLNALLPQTKQQPTAEQQSTADEENSEISSSLEFPDTEQNPLEDSEVLSDKSDEEENTILQEEQEEQEEQDFLKERIRIFRDF
jgi:plasmid maintenance system antidote protein VapI